MDDAQFDDLKQFITATVSQATTDMATKDDVGVLKKDVNSLKSDINRLETKIDDLDLKVDTISYTLNVD